MQIITPESEDQQVKHKITVFLAGSIEMGLAELWHPKVADAFKDADVTFFNPRIPFWDKGWVAKLSDPNFEKQVNWEWDRLNECDVIFMYLQPGTKSPISMYELGRFYQKHIILCCPEGFWREGNMEFYAIKNHHCWEPDFDKAVEKLQITISTMMEMLYQQHLS